MYMYTYTDVYMPCICIRICIFVCAYVDPYLFDYVYVFVYVDVRLCFCLYVHVYPYAQTRLGRRLLHAWREGPVPHELAPGHR